MQQHQPDYRHYLKTVFETKAKNNPSFSLRSFARMVGISPGHLSRVLSGEKQLSVDAATRISSALKHTESEAAFLRDLVILATTSSDRVRTEALDRLERSQENKGFRSLDMEHFRVISDWHHFAILNLMNTRGFRSDDRWIAKRLGISVAEAKAALQRLESLELIEMSSGKYQIRSGPSLTTPDDIASSALRKFHKQVLAKAALAIDEQSVHEREFDALTVSFDPAELPRAKKLIREFVTRMDAELERKKGTEVYQLNVQFFRVSQKETL